MQTKLSDLGFQPGQDVKLLPRIILAIGGLEKQGKSHFSLTAPGPIAYINLDDGLEGVVQKFVQEKKIHILSLRLPDVSIGDEAEVKRLATEEWAKFYTGYCGALASPDIRTLVIDTGTELRELQLMHLFGRTSQIMPYMYREPNAKFRRLIRDAFNFNKNVIFLQKMKKKYVNDKWNGEYEDAGFNDVGYLTQINAQVYRYSQEDGGEFVFYFRNCRQNQTLVGVELAGPLCNFQMVAQMVLPDVDPKNWE